MFYFSFISHVRTDLFFNVLKTLKQLWNAKTICFRVLFHVVRAALAMYGHNLHSPSMSSSLMALAYTDD